MVTLSTSSASPVTSRTAAQTQAPVSQMVESTSRQRVGFRFDQLLDGDRLGEPGCGVYDGVGRSGFARYERVAPEAVAVVYGSEAVGQVEVGGPFAEVARALARAEERGNQHLPLIDLDRDQGRLSPSSEIRYKREGDLAGRLPRLLGHVTGVEQSGAPSETTST